MKSKFTLAVLICGSLMLLDACATREGMEEIEETGMQSQKILRENERRLNNLENSVSELNSQLAQLNSRTYEVRTRSGQRTSMKVIPVQGSQTAAPAPAKVAEPAKSAAPAGKKINPAAKPSPLPANAQRKPVTPKPVPVPAPAAAASGSIGQGNQENIPAPPVESADLAMPPTELETSPSPAHTYSGSTISAHAETGIANSPANVVPVPSLPPSDLSLPPETPNLPSGVGQPSVDSAPVANAPQTTPPPAPKNVPVKSVAGEEAAYQAALKAARSGNTSEGIRLFRDFLQKYPNGRYTANADYWLGECLYAQGKYQDALNQFQTVNSSYPSHHKNADALLKAGLTLSKMGNKEAAQQKFRQVLSSFPNSDAAKRVRSMGIR